MFSVLVIRLRSLRLLRVSGIVMRLRMFLLLITFLKASHSFRNRLLGICKNAYLFRSEERFSRNAETDLVCRLLLEKKTDQKAVQYYPGGARLEHSHVYDKPRRVYFTPQRHSV